MATVNIFEAKTTLSRLIESVETGAAPEVIIARNGRPAARLVPVSKASTGARIGVAKGRFSVPEDIDETNDAVAGMFGVAEPEAS